MGGKEAKDEHISLVHNRKHIDFIKSISSKEEMFWKEMAKKYNSVYFNQGSSEAAYISAGCVIEVTSVVSFYLSLKQNDVLFYLFILTKQ